MKGNLLIIGFCFFSVSILASTGAALDSVGVEREGDKTFIIHEVSPQETLFGISRRYSTPVNEIVQSNETLKDGLKIGQRIRIPYIEKKALPEGALLHQVAQGETLFAISQKYKVSVADLKAWNDLQGNDLSMGQGLIIQRLVSTDAPVPTEKLEETVAVADQKVAITNRPVEGTNPAARMPRNAGSTASGRAAANNPKVNEKPNPSGTPVRAEGPTSNISTIGGWKSHTVAQGETLFSISKQYEANVEDLISWNALSSNNLSPGQTLKVGRETGASIPVTTYPGPEKPASANAETSRPQVSGAGTSASNSEASSTAFKNIKETGQAEVIEGTGNHKKYLVLHRDAPVGTIMRVRNESNDITIFARVVGALPNTGDNNKLIIKVSKAAFDQLKAVNSRFPVEVSY
ncbi:MAG TPA: LysM peptidoglycan-binding domain-containing protein [Lunatimonas sp.]|nr:LysM peptidoglycan-binding domain-containing protein [Lunatimonas sp.]